MDHRTKKYEWINKIYICRLLNIDLMDIINYEIKPAIGKGNNYASTLLRVEVELKNNMKNKFLIKCLPEGVMETLIQDSGLWSKEMYMYNKVLPLIEKCINCKLGPKCLNNKSFAIDDDDDDCDNENFIYNNNKEIVIEDLSDDYKMADRREQLDFDHCVIVMKTLAKFHAGSVAVKKINKKYIDLVGEELLFRQTRRESNEQYLKQPFICLGNELNKNNNNKNNELKHYSKNLKKFCEKLWDLGIFATKSKEFNVLNHGDLWTNNILFKYNDITGDVEEAKFIDFQCCRYATPALDLQYFFMSSVKEEVRETKLQELVDIYINCLNKELINLGQKQLSEKQLDKDLMITDFYGLYAAVSVLPLSIRDPEGVIDEEDITDWKAEDNTFLKCIKGKKYRQLLPNILMYFDKKGLFEDNYDIIDKFGIDDIENNIVI
ncbi:uncharacterized protein LOC142327694 [Lycorma delicatula]|uniref:uncharacterized protein LOC142327694 n=1 Tax=Lycorma delicatula TaxID=130591 RepID=UPI003F515ABD